MPRMPDALVMRVKKAIGFSELVEIIDTDGNLELHCKLCSITYKVNEPHVSAQFKAHIKSKGHQGLLNEKDLKKRPHARPIKRPNHYRLHRTQPCQRADEPQPSTSQQAAECVPSKKPRMRGHQKPGKNYDTPLFIQIDDSPPSSPSQYKVLTAVTNQQREAPNVEFRPANEQLHVAHECLRCSMGYSCASANYEPALRCSSYGAAYQQNDQRRSEDTHSRDMTSSTAQLADPSSSYPSSDMQLAFRTSLLATAPPLEVSPNYPKATPKSSFPAFRTLTPLETHTYASYLPASSLDMHTVPGTSRIQPLPLRQLSPNYSGSTSISSYTASEPTTPLEMQPNMFSSIHAYPNLIPVPNQFALPFNGYYGIPGAGFWSRTSQEDDEQHPATYLNPGAMPAYTGYAVPYYPYGMPAVPMPTLQMGPSPNYPYDINKFYQYGNTPTQFSLAPKRHRDP